MRVLLVEDDELLGSAVQAGLEQSGYTVDWLRDGRQAASALQDEEPDLLVLDLGLPAKDGLTVLRELRARDSTLPVLILTARDTVEDRIAGLDVGADDYLVKPFDLGELTARLRAIARRRGGRANPLIRYGDLVFDPAARTVSIDGDGCGIFPPRPWRSSRPCWNGRACPCRGNAWSRFCMAGARAWRAMRSRCISTICARNWAKTGSGPSGGLAT